MNSVFSAFKSSKSGDSKSKHIASKKINQDLNSYENLRHLREIGSSSKMSTFMDNDVGTTTVSLGKRCSTPVQPIPTSLTLVDSGHDTVDFRHNGLDLDLKTLCDQNDMIIEGQLKLNIKSFEKPPPPPPPPTSSSESSIVSEKNVPSSNEINLSNKHNRSDNVILTRCSDKNSCNVNNNFGSNRLNRPRLSLSGISNNNTLPSVHGRHNGAGGNNSNGPHKTRLSTHQRNLSLDFR